MPSRCPNSRLIVANIVSRSVRLLTSARTARLPAPSVSLAGRSDPSFKPQMATRAPSLSNSCAAASPIPLLPPVMRMFLSASLPIVVLLGSDGDSDDVETRFPLQAQNRAVIERCETHQAAPAGHRGDVLDDRARRRFRLDAGAHRGDWGEDPVSASMRRTTSAKGVPVH